MSQDPATDTLLDLLRTQRTGVLVTLKRDGRPQLSNVSFAYDDGTRTIRISATDDRAKTRNLRRDPRASFYVGTPDHRAYLVAEGDAELTPVAADKHDATVEELIDVYRKAVGEHPDWDDYRAAMVADKRLVISLRADRAYGMGALGHISGPLD
ncbi:PPOX class F420-dependent oxidoreductase [Actinacidiphila bryophytorum]|uniref:PPOX class F420-dependent enzyme n=1 Tax=Actinacidiphila bryophytorum TaxID=1436133 RepID=A0A9W4ML22_9ACTN|nr:PPOX class F420-dependent oxidoreductase [Actinacidiphila bryophytorum]MBM9440798.1 PPOX class F420-dependent oxidoreductase [Actinacidiphila bryophytorum]MBN6546544.1 PPOX class F420-dependent oxidoreductase [Actinacidiphila bryophytorum]CAG7657361.1 putative PPOX class F420-dependent enzyme [Actinacidiphila bryophytorum]